MATSNTKLYSYFRSSCSWRVRIALNLKKIEYETIPVHLVRNGGEQKSEEYQKINPRSYVPALVIDGHTLIESLPIIEYLEETRPEIPLLPKNAADRATVRAICEIINSGIQPLQNLTVLQKVENEYKADKMAWAKDFIERGLTSLEQLLTQTRGKYCFGDNITIADVFLVPQAVSSFSRFGIDTLKYPIIKEIVDNLANEQAFIDALPQNQPDFEK